MRSYWRKHRLAYRVTQIGLLAWAALFFVIIAPGHVRGLVEYERADSATASQIGTFADLFGLGDGPCLVAKPSCCSSSGPDSKQPNPFGRRCAVCQIIATCDVPPPMQFFVPLYQRRVISPAEVAQSQYDRSIQRCFGSRAPPA